MLVFPNFAANLAQTEDVVTKYADIVQSEAELGLPLSGKGLPLTKLPNRCQHRCIYKE